MLGTMKGEDEKAMDSGDSNGIKKQIDEQVSLFLEGTPEPHSQGSLDVRFGNLNVIGAGLGVSIDGASSHSLICYLLNRKPLGAKDSHRDECRPTPFAYLQSGSMAISTTSCISKASPQFYGHGSWW